MAGKSNRNGDLQVSEQMQGLGYYTPKKHWPSRLAPYAPEWAGYAAVWPVTYGVHEWLATDPAVAPWASAGLSLLGVGLTAVTWQCARARAALTRKFATATSGITAAWMTAGTIAGPGETPLLELWAVGGAGVALSWSIYKALKRGGDGEEGENGLFEQVKLAGVKPAATQVEPNRVTTRLQLPRGEMEVSEVQKATGRIASLFGLGKGAVRVTENPDDSSQATMTIVPRDVLKNPSPWPGPSAPGGSIMEPIRVGLYEDTEPQVILFPGDKSEGRNATHYGVQGMNGSGKSHGAKEAWTDILTRRDAGLIVMDPSKGEQTVGFLGDAPYQVVTGEKACKKAVKRLPGLITDRASQLGQWGYDQWVPAAFEQHGLPYLVVWIEESPRVLDDAKTVIRIAQEARSAGISLVLSLQKATFRNMPTDVRSQLGGVWCFGVNDIEDAGYLLSEDTIEGGARPDRWKNRRPGCNYLEGPGIDEARYTTPGRTHDHTDDQLRAAIDAHAGIRPAMHSIDARHLDLTAPATDQPTMVAGADGVEPTPDFESLDNLDPSDAADFDDEPIALPELADPELTVDDEHELPADTTTLDFPGGRPTRKEAVALLRSHIEQMAAAGRTQLTVRDFPDPEATYGRGRSWVSGELDKLTGTLLHRVGKDGRADIYRLATPHEDTDTPHAA
ncbi:plasmid transfer protein TraB [Saccharopolyspora gregorii]|uniref:plasmid transfer protein TraB n=1 Tax=Saccharopolyspora gregorii TaxID=33914 RepID=UPI0021AC6794|nr:plasmid transfer protein TraB [Saccharopolyspora gregorii]